MWVYKENEKEFFAKNPEWQCKYRIDLECDDVYYIFVRTLGFIFLLYYVHCMICYFSKQEEEATQIDIQ